MNWPSRKTLSPSRILCLVAWVACVPTVAEAQNDWQFPDPYFGILEFEKSVPDRRNSSRRRGWDSVGKAAAKPAGGSSAVPAERMAPGIGAAGVPDGEVAGDLTTGAAPAHAAPAQPLPPSVRQPPGRPLWRRRAWRQPAAG